MWEALAGVTCKYYITAKGTHWARTGKPGETAPLVKVLLCDSRGTGCFLSSLRWLPEKQWHSRGAGRMSQGGTGINFQVSKGKSLVGCWVKPRICTFVSMMHIHAVRRHPPALSRL